MPIYAKKLAKCFFKFHSTFGKALKGNDRNFNIIWTIFYSKNLHFQDERLLRKINLLHGGHYSSSMTEIFHLQMFYVFFLPWFRARGNVCIYVYSQRSATKQTAHDRVSRHWFRGLYIFFTEYKFKSVAFCSYFNYRYTHSITFLNFSISLDTGQKCIVLVESFHFQKKKLSENTSI
jgi:hypothetical protein